MAKITDIAVSPVQTTTELNGEIYNVKEIYLTREEIADTVKQETGRRIKEHVVGLEDNFSVVLRELKKLADKDYVVMEKPQVWYDRKNVAVWPMAAVAYWSSVSAQKYNNYTYNASIAGVKDDTLKFTIPTYQEVRRTFDINIKNPISESNYDRICYYDGSNYTHLLCLKNGIGGFMPYRKDDFMNFGGYYNLIAIPIHRFQGPNAAKATFAESVKIWIEHGMIPEGLHAGVKRKYLELLQGLQDLKNYIDIKNATEKEETLVINYTKLFNDVAIGKIKSVNGQDFDVAKEINEVSSGKRKLTLSRSFRELLLNCDKVRANLNPYPDIMLKNYGHWDLCEPSPAGNSDYIKVELTDKDAIAARPPQKDVRLDSVCGIDFGTKSTVVATFYNEAKLLSVGKFDYTKPSEQQDFENPTAIQVKDYTSFVKAYHEREGRPYTKWNQITASHEAAQALYEQGIQNSSVYNSVLSELKQWAGDKERKLRLRDLSGHEVITIPPYLSLKKGEFDPIEIYAYYLGLYINNMNNKAIYLNYLMSFPVTYSKEVRAKLLDSFRRGLKKSLPIALQNDSELMSHFHVNEGASEPASYAITALKEFGLEPNTASEKVYYSVFDFGGGTTDFDFGYEEVPEQSNRRKRKCNFKLHQFGRGGLNHLGGENILQRLAFEVYKENISKLGPKQIGIVYPPGGKRIDDYEHLMKPADISSEAAAYNTKLLASVLRPLWEKPDGYDKLDLYKSERIKLNLFAEATDENGVSSFEEELHVSKDHLEQVINESIEEGVVNFFAACRTAFKGYSEVNGSIHIFLAGNSSKAENVKVLFEKHIEQEQAKYANIKFELHLPLPKIQEVCNYEPVSNKKAGEKSVKKPKEEKVESLKSTGNTDASKQLINYSQLKTGKTGVVFGLLRSRPEARDVLIVNEENDFPFIIGDGDSSYSNFEPYEDIDLATCNQWIEFAPADRQYTEIYYTSEPVAREGRFPLNKCHKKTLIIKQNEVSDDEKVMIYIRKIAPNVLEYTVADEERIKEPQVNPYRLEL